MSRPPVEGNKAILAKAGITVAGGGAGSAVTLLAVHKPAATIVIAACIAAGAIASAGARAIESVWSRRSGVIAAKGKAKADRIRAKADEKALLIRAASEAEALGLRTRTYTAVVQAGLDAQAASQAKEMLAFLPVNPDLPENKRLSDDALKETLADLLRQTGSPSKGPRPRSSSVVVSMPRRGN